MRTFQTFCVDCGRDFILKLGPRGGYRPHICQECLEERELERRHRPFAPLPREPRRRPTRRCIRCGGPAASQRHWYCAACRALTKRGTAPRKPQAPRQARGYGAAHDRQRRELKRQVDAGNAYCRRCGRWLPPGSKFHASHPGDDKTLPPEPWCVPCNTSYAAAVTRPRLNRQRKAGRR